MTLDILYTGWVICLGIFAAWAIGPRQGPCRTRESLLAGEAVEA